MNVISSDHSPKEIRNRETKEFHLKSKKLKKRAPDSSIPKESLIGKTSQLRNQIIRLQRSISKTQRILGGLEGFRNFLDSGDKSLSPAGLPGYINRVTYKNEAVLSPYKENLQNILVGRDSAALNELIGEVHASLEKLAGELSRFEIAEQNARSLTSSVTGQLEALAPRKIIEGIKKDGELLFRLKSENVLSLLS